MNEQRLTFDQVFAIWLVNEVGNPEEVNYLPVAQEKGFDSVVEWRLSTALKLGLNTKEWFLSEVAAPEEVLPKIIIGPFKGWSQFFDNKFNTSFSEALEIPEFLKWCEGHDRIPQIAEHFPTPTTIILLRKQNGDLIHIEGGHRICAYAYAAKIGKPIEASVTAAIANVSDEEIEKLLLLLEEGTDKK